MKKCVKISYTIRIIAFILNFLLLFLMVGTLLHLKPMFYIFLVLYIIYVFNILKEMLSQNECYKNDLVYNCMQIGMFLYYLILFYRIRFSYVSINTETMSYFNVNFIIISLLIVFILCYSKIEFKKSGSFKWKR